jgi:lipoprotein-releasing system ATP-binding protein
MPDVTVNNTVLQLAGIRKQYGSDGVITDVLHGIDMTLQQGEFTALIGPSGSGKSTLLNIIGLLERATAGSLTMLGRDTGTLSEAELTMLRGRSIGFVFQFHHLIPSFTALENVMMPLMLEQGRPTAVQRERAASLLARVGLEDRLDFKPAKMSGGQQQRVAIARALVNNPAVILADEPTGNLDSSTSEEIMNLFTTLNRQGITIIMVTHELDVAAYAGRQITFKDGRLISDRATNRVT